MKLNSDDSGNLIPCHTAEKWELRHNGKAHKLQEAWEGQSPKDEDSHHTRDIRYGTCRFNRIKSQFFLGEIN